MALTDKIGVLLLNLGGPEKPEDVRPFLFNLFSDRRIIRLGPAFLQKSIARMIVRKRAPESIANYRRIGGGSPLGERTAEQARALMQGLRADGDFVVQPCMRYWHPFAGEALAALRAVRADRIIALPLYPHYSLATTGSSLADLHQENNRAGLHIPISAIHAWPEEPHYIACLAERIREGMACFQDGPVQLLYSAHSLPVRCIAEGDPYVNDLERTIQAVEAVTGIPGRLCYQSRSGPVEWLGPSLPEAASACRNLLVMPLSFVSDHIETLYEIDIQYRRLAESLGMHLVSTRALNSDPLFIEGLRALVLGRLAAEGR